MRLCTSLGLFVSNILNHVPTAKTSPFSSAFFRPASQSSCSSTTCCFPRYLLIPLIDPSNTSIKEVARYMDIFVVLVVEDVAITHGIYPLRF
ncbi:hypothetical protein FIBSPDRAFT_960795 [Athelia psychrophila]|uniref:Uncharacterized protein n=1 Tax=Athelia psychrophila TaxID=1759441 RepID=A0A166BYZ8_9AGAM|nr:hypothetical protein FIBSPDRAFT_960795 [Fibularhizoctonia sp. CBS 109695]